MQWQVGLRPDNAATGVRHTQDGAQFIESRSQRPTDVSRGEHKLKDVLMPQRRRTSDRGLFTRRRDFADPSNVIVVPMRNDDKNDLLADIYAEIN